jgi:hypothetical protein
MRCDPDYCDIHDFVVAPGSAWCQMEYRKRGSEGSRLATEMGLAEAINRMADLVQDLLDERQTRFRPRYQAAPDPPKEKKEIKPRGYQWSQE